MADTAVTVAAAITARRIARHIVRRTVITTIAITGTPRATTAITIITVMAATTATVCTLAFGSSFGGRNEEAMARLNFKRRDPLAKMVSGFF